MENATGINIFPAIGNSSSKAMLNRDPISNEMLQQFHIVMTGVWYAICFLGIGTNIVNTRIFLKIGLEDSVTVSLFALAISDLSLCSVATIELSSFLINVVGKEQGLFFFLPPLIATFYTMCIRRIFTTTTVLITTFLAIQRCICVALPFRVHTIFNRFRTSCFLIVILTFDAIVHLVFLSQHTTVVTSDPVTNVSQVGLVVPDSSEPIPFLVEVIIGIAMNISCQGIVVVCLVILAIALKRSVRFKKSMTIHATTSEKGVTNTDANRATNATSATNKEYQAIIQVGLLSIIFVVTNIPLLTFGITNIIVPGIDLYGEFHNVYHFIQNIMYTAELLNSSVNLFVYYKYNSRFRSCLQGKSTGKT